MQLKFRKKPIVIEAFQMTRERRGDNSEWPEWMHRAWNEDRGTPGSLYPTEPGTSNGTVSIGTLEGPLLVSFGDWIIRGVQGEIYPCKPDIFEATYEPVCDQGLGKAAGASYQAAKLDALKELLIAAKGVLDVGLNPRRLRLDAAIRQAERVFYIERRRDDNMATG